MPSHLNPPSSSSTNGLAASLTPSIFSASTVVNNGGNDGSDGPPFSFDDLEDKTPREQLSMLNNQLAHQRNIKEGAENLLNMQLAGSLRHRLESELQTAQTMIDALNKRMDIQASRTKLNGAPPSNRKQHSTNGSVSTQEDLSGEDFRSALQNATNLLKTLISPLPSSAISPSSTSSTSPSTSKVPQGLNSLDINRQRIDLMGRVIAILRRHLRVRYELNLSDVMDAVLPALSDTSTKQCRATAYRLIRHSLVDADSVRRLDQALDWYLLKTFHRDSRHAVEKEQAIKLIRAMIEIGTVRKDAPVTGDSGTVPLSDPVMRTLVAVAEHADDPFRPICVQTLIEILLIDIDLVARTGALRFLLHVLGEGPIELGSLAASAFLHIADSPRTRAYLCVGVDLELALSAVTDAYGKGPEHANRMRSSIRIIQQMLRTWSGLLYFCMDDMRAIRALVDTLRIPSLETREVIVDMFFSLLNIKSTSWYQTFIDGRRLTMYHKNRDKAEGQAPDGPDRGHSSLKLTDQYFGLLILIFNHSGIFDALTALVEESAVGTNLTRKATLLAAEILQLANRVLPMSIAANIQAVPRVFEMAADYKDGQHRIIGTTTMAAMDSLNRNRARLEPIPLSNKQNRPRANSIEDAVRRGQRQVEQVKLKMNMQMDDKAYQTLVTETQIMSTKDHAKWSFEHLHELVEGPLLNAKRLDDAIRVSRSIRRLMSFFYPFNHRFSDLPRTKANARWVKLGCSILTTLMANSDGVRYLSTDDLLVPQIVKSFAQLDPFNGTPDSDPIFSKRRVADTLTYGYLEMLGTLSKFKEGIEILEKNRVFTAFYHLSELRSREDLIKGIIETLDYSIDGHPRIILSKALTSSYKHIRLFATRHLGLLIRSSPTANSWTLRLLLTQLYDPAPDVCEVAVHYLEEVCEAKDILQLVVEMQPTMDHLGDIGHGLLLKFMSTPIGFRYLYDAGYIDREMDMWFHERNLYYVVQVEVFLAKVFNSGNLVDDDEDLSDATVPPHFYGEMAKTDLGCQILQEKGHFSEFSQFIRKHYGESDDPELILKLKSILWAVGHVGSTEGGLPFLEEEEIIPAVLDIAQKSPIPSVRGTCFFVLGLISTTTQGAEILDDYNWEATLTPLGLPTGLCVPVEIEKFVTIPPWTQHVLDKSGNRLLAPTSEFEVEVITAIQNLANTVIANAASRSLTRMKSRPEYRPIFTSPTMFFRALHIISTQRYRLPVRRYILDLFNLELNQNTVAGLKEAAKNLKASATYKPPPETSRMSMFGRLGRGRRPEESDDSSEDDDSMGDNSPPPSDDKPVINLRPVSRIIGFAV
ncbi:hypothetical protein BDN72DRAFT_805030 [Pluteus cervinus]|uniref:Uncharacterized protein n=1 Tax=Pluteus cervinus TaxID=181527 RepID=A0ACD3A6Y0_9AGAR|nr:hypothetical protein BDN72DRAFT_805030 [Pluteus cervinus]